MGPAVSASSPLLAYGPAASLIRRPAHENLPGTVRWAEKRPGGRRIVRTLDGLFSEQDESTSDFLSADFADERRWGESQRQSVAWFDWRIQQSLRSRFVGAPPSAG